MAGTSYGLGSKYNNIAIYQNELTEAQILRHYNYYIGNWSNVIGQEVLSIQESASGNDLTAYSVYSIELAGSNITI